jgi:hypothetical protein
MLEMKTIPFITELIPRGERWRLIGRHTAKTGISLAFIFNQSNI